MRWGHAGLRPARWGSAARLLVIQPSIAAFGYVALWPLGTAFFFAFYMLVTRAMAAYMHPVTMQAHTSFAGIVLCVPLMVLFDGTGWAQLDPVMPGGWNWLWLFGVGFWAGVSHMCMTYALKFAPSATLAPLHYTEIVAAVALGYLIFGDFPNPHDLGRDRGDRVIGALCHPPRTDQRAGKAAGGCHAAPRSDLSAASSRARGRMTSMPGPSIVR